MDLDSLQTRRFYLAGTVAFPAPFPGAGEISIKSGSVSRSADGKRNDQVFVILHEESGFNRTVKRVFLKDDVAAIFIPGAATDTDQGRRFRFAERDSVRDLENGEWILNADIDVDKISQRLGIDIRSPTSGARGIVFVPEQRPVLTITELTQPAGAVGEAIPDKPQCECQRDQDSSSAARLRHPCAFFV